MVRYKTLLDAFNVRGCMRRSSMKNLLKKLPRSKSKSRKAEKGERTTAEVDAAATETEVEMLRVPHIATADLKVSAGLVVPCGKGNT